MLQVTQSTSVHTGHVYSGCRDLLFRTPYMYDGDVSIIEERLWEECLRHTCCFHIWSPRHLKWVDLLNVGITSNNTITIKHQDNSNITPLKPRSRNLSMRTSYLNLRCQDIRCGFSDICPEIAEVILTHHYHPGNTAQWQNVDNRSWLRSVNMFCEIPCVGLSRFCHDRTTKQEGLCIYR